MNHGYEKQTHEVIVSRWRWGWFRIPWFGTRMKSVKDVYSRRVGYDFIDEVLLFCIPWRYRSL
jgi:hypothetical protein